MYRSNFAKFWEASVLADYEDFDTDNVVKVPAYTGSSAYVQPSYNSNLVVRFMIIVIIVCFLFDDEHFGR